MFGLVGLFVQNFDSIQLVQLMFHQRDVTGYAPSTKPGYDLGLHCVRSGVYRPAYCGMAHYQKTTPDFFFVCFQLVFFSATCKNYTHLLILLHKLTARDRAVFRTSFTTVNLFSAPPFAKTPFISFVCPLFSNGLFLSVHIF